MPESVFVRVGEDKDRFCATELASGPWDPRAAHAGAPAALLVRAFEALLADAELPLARVTYELMRPVPLGELVVEASISRSGRRVRLLEASLRSAEHEELVRARGLAVARAQGVTATPLSPPPPGPMDGAESDFRGEGAMFVTDAMEIRLVAGSFNELGPATAWFRLRAALIDGEEPSPLQRLAAAGDFGNGISAVVSWDDHVFINADLTLYIERPPVGEWICLKSETRIAQDGIGISDSVLYDERGRVGRALQALVVARR